MAEQSSLEKKRATIAAENTGEAERIKDSTAVPLPDTEPYWNIGDVSINDTGNSGMFGLFKKKSFDENILLDLRSQATSAPGATKVATQKLIEKHGKHPTLVMISAICAYGMVMNSANSESNLKGLKQACKDAGSALLRDQISVQNCETFVKIYFTYLERLKREQNKTLSMIRKDPQLKRYQDQLNTALRVCDQLKQDQTRVTNMIGHLKKRLKSSNYSTTINFFEMNKAAQLFEKGDKKKTVGLGKAEEIVSYIYLIGSAFARIPLLNPLVGTLLRQIPEKDHMLALRKVSLTSIQNLTRLKLLTIEGDIETIRIIAKTIFRDNYTAIQKMEEHTITQVYECDPYFNLALVTELTNGLFDKKFYTQMLERAQTAVDTVIRLDMTKNHVFTEIARQHTQQLSGLQLGMETGNDE
ncbi:MAG: hypothetical protein GY786_08200 [Proteobacteria bacterium]|nr:hypothetical protein [Pseudomonadota bacterium]